MRYAARVRTLLVVLIVLGCKGSERKPPPPRVSTLPALPAAPTATIDPPDAKAGFPREQPAIVLWQGGGEPPRTILGVRVWADGTVRFRCNRRGTLPAARVTAMLETFDRAGWLPAAGSAAPPEADTTCITTSVQVARDGKVTRRNSACGETTNDIADAVAFVQTVVGRDPCAH